MYISEIIAKIPPHNRKALECISSLISSCLVVPVPDSYINSLHSVLFQLYLDRYISSDEVQILFNHYYLNCYLYT